jgi:type I restriction enzyme, R subunit
MTPEARARQAIDASLEASGWVVQDQTDRDLSAGLGVAVREFPTSNGPADYLLFVNKVAVGVLEAKKVGETLSAVADQTEKYLTGKPLNVPEGRVNLRFGYESTGVETVFRDLRDPESRSRTVFALHRPETLAQWLQEPQTLRARLRSTPTLEAKGLRECQVNAITGLERSLALGKPRALIQMATGAGKTFTAVSSVYRLAKHCDAERVLFLVDRANLGRQTLAEFQSYVTPDDGRKFTELYNVQLLESNRIDPVAKVVITTIQRLYSILRGEADFDTSLEEQSQHELGMDAKPVTVGYNPSVPPEFFDLVITDECHRSIYNVWRGALEYFDAFLVGLTATPSKQTFGFFNGNLVTEYTYEKSVADGVNVGFDVYRIRTQVTQEGVSLDAGEWVYFRDKVTRKMRWEQLDEDTSYSSRNLDRSVVVKSQLRTVLRHFLERTLPETFPGRTYVPKTLVFAKDDSHAEDIVKMLRDEFGFSNDAVKKITYAADKPEDLIKQFRTSFNPRIAVTVDMVSTGTDIRPLECVFFMRDVRSNLYYQQMVGRGTRTVDPNELQSVTPDAAHKSRFVLVDAVGVVESHKTDMRPLERKKGVSFDKLLNAVSLGARDEDTVVSLANRLARLERELDPSDRREVEAAAGTPLTKVVGALLEAFDPDTILERARADTGSDAPSEAQHAHAAEALLEDACAPFDRAKFRRVLLEVKGRNEQTIDATTQDTVLEAGLDTSEGARALSAVQNFQQYISEHRDEITALQVYYSRPQGQRPTLELVKRLANSIARPPFALTPERLWAAYERLETSRVKPSSTTTLLTNLVSLVRFALQETETLEAFPETVDRKYNEWLAVQASAGRVFTPEQLEWLDLIKARVADSLAVTPEDLAFEPFADRGGVYKASKVFGGELEGLLNELSQALVA